jgi:hypothetical protein
MKACTLNSATTAMGHESASSRTPVEIWMEIIAFVLSGSDYLFMNPDPLKGAINVPATLAKWKDQREPKQLLITRRNMKLVCKTWKKIVEMAPLDYVDVAKFKEYDASIRLFKARRIQGGLKPWRCRCTRRCDCNIRPDDAEKIMRLSNDWSTFLDSEDMKKLDVEILSLFLGMEQTLSHSIRLPKLRAITVKSWPNQNLSLLSSNFPNLQYLEISFWSFPSNSAIDLPLLTTLYLRLDLPHFLSSLEFINTKWSVPKLQHLLVISKIVMTSVERSACLEVFGSSLISLTLQQRSNAEFGFQMGAGFWDRLPCLRYLAIDLHVFNFQPPPENHPLCALVDTGTASYWAFRSMGYHIASCPQLKTVSLAFRWGDCIEGGGSVTPRTPGMMDVVIDWAKGLASVCEVAGVRLEDYLGQTYEEWRRNVSV